MQRAVILSALILLGGLAFDFIKIQFAESGERRITRAKIINRNSYAQ